jgi:hypothetical protein
LGHGFRAGSDDLVGKAKRDEKALGNKGMGFKDLGWKESNLVGIMVETT